ncbi:FtsX-like permease family protein [Paracoccaceae bacterium Fryx2]|nr:FtsX-like permease family protein [Paracoccaceae bacterium Fryx2]
MRRAGLAALLSHWRRHPLQLAMLLLGLALATALWSGVQAINAEARASYDRAAGALGQDAMARIVARGGGTVAEADYVALRRAGWPVSPVVEGRLMPSGLRLIGIEPLTLPRSAQRVPVLEGGDAAAFLSGPGLLFASAETAAGLDGAGLPPLRVAEDLPPGTALADIGVAQRLLRLEGRLSHLLLPDAPHPDPATLPAGLVLHTPAPAEDLARLTDSFHLNLTAFGLLAFAVGLFIVHSAIGLAFEQRRPVFRTLRALGIPARTLTGLLLAELLVLALVAGVLGVVLGYGVAALLLPDVAATLRGLYGAEVPGTLSLRPSWWLAGLGIAVLGTLVAAAQSLWRVWRLPLLAPAQPRAWARASAAGLRWQAGLGLALLAGALALGLAGRGLWAGFGVLGGLLLGAALLLPVFLTAVTWAGERLSRGVLTQWFWADTRQQLPGLSLALMALLLALAANVGVGTMVASFRLTFTGWLDQRLASELYITARDPAEAAAMADWLGPRSDAVLPIWNAETLILGAKGEVYGVTDHATYRDNWPLLQAVPDVWQAVAEGRALLVNEQLARRAGLAMGDAVPLPGGALPVAGIYSDYGNPQPQVIVSTETLTARFPDTPRLRFAVRVAPAEAGALAADLRAAFDLPETAVIDQATIKAFSLRIFERTFAVTAALNVLTLGVAGLAMFASLMTLAGMRLPQLAPVWAMGLTRARLAGLDLARTLLLAMLVLAAALPLGLALAWVLLAVVNVAAFGWRLPMRVFPADWLLLGGLALLAALVAAAIPVLRLARTPPGDLVKVFTNER